MIRVELVFFMLMCGGCASVASWQPANLESVELVGVPFEPQTTDQCGPASLTMLLEDAGVSLSVDTMRDRVYVPRRGGSLQVELLAATREAGRIAYLIEPTPDALLRELAAGRPVLVLQDLKIAWRSRWHYAVVVGFLPEQDVFVLRSGPTERLLMDRRRFLKVWFRGGNWGFVALAPGVVPADASDKSYLRAVAAFESANTGAAIIQSYAAAVNRWPNSIAAQFGLANGYYAQAAFHDALPLYEAIVEQNPNYLPALNNLAMVYRDLGQRQNALATIEQAIASADQWPLRATLIQSRCEILERC